jgi:hypothetical protein
VTRTLFAWLVIVVGLALLVGGFGMIYMFSIVKNNAAPEAARQVGVPGGYASAVISIVVGLVVTLVGFGLRPPQDRTPERRRRGKRRRDRTGED